MTRLLPFLFSERAPTLNGAEGWVGGGWWIESGGGKEEEETDLKDCCRCCLHMRQGIWEILCRANADKSS